MAVFEGKDFIIIDDDEDIPPVDYCNIRGQQAKTASLADPENLLFVGSRSSPLPRVQTASSGSHDSVPTSSDNSNQEENPSNFHHASSRRGTNETSSTRRLFITSASAAESSRSDAAGNMIPSLSSPKLIWPMPNAKQNNAANPVDLTDELEEMAASSIANSENRIDSNNTSSASVSSNDPPSSQSSSPITSKTKIMKTGDNLEDAIDLDDLEAIGEQKLLEGGLSQEPDLQILRVNEISNRNASSPSPPKPSRMFPKRNPPIVFPYEKLDRYKHGPLDLRSAKTVEVFGGDFIRIKDIIRDTQTDKVTIRGHQLQRCKDLNAMLERKLNEVCLFLEIDLDDPREALEQSVVEVPVADIIKFRSLHCTNHEFPECRNFPPMKSILDKTEVFDKGGLTLRWKYTCTFLSAADRYDNVYKERALEHIREDDVLATLKTSDAERRVKWRGETVLGGSCIHRSTANVPAQECHGQNRHESISSTTSSSVIILDTKFLKRKLSHGSSGSFSNNCLDRQNSKKSKQEYGGSESTRLQVSEVTLSKIVIESGRSPLIFDLTGDDDASNNSISKTSISTEHKNLPPLAPSASTPSINISSSPLSTPPPTGTTEPCNTPCSTTHPPKTSIFTKRTQKYTYGDAFCGAGGTTRGALAAGLHIKWGFDLNPHACSTWRANFPHATCYEMAADEFVRNAQISPTNPNPADVKVDILHLSPPCQYFSPAHTLDGINDEQNVAAMFAVRAVIEVSKPRIVTLEQTFGIMQVKHRAFFAALIHMFTSLRFSLRWAIVGLPQWGLPQRRNRLIIIAACPGEILPQIPPPTHIPSSSPSSPLPPYTTAFQTLSTITPTATLHSPSSVLFSPTRFLPPWNAHQILPRAMTTSGGQNYHPSGKRDLTLREYACLQGFPIEHVFRGTGVKRQIGNAVPPVCAGVLFRGVREALRGRDGEEGQREGEKGRVLMELE